MLCLVGGKALQPNRFMYYSCLQLHLSPFFSFVRPICANLAVFPHIAVSPSTCSLPAASLNVPSGFHILFRFFHKPTLYSTSPFLHSSSHLLPPAPSPLYTCLHLPPPPLPSALTLCFLGKELVSSVGRDPPSTALTPSPPPCSLLAAVWVMTICTCR